MRVNNTKIVVLENPQVYDRYTIINVDTGDVWGASDNPYHPCGVGGYGCNILTDLKWTSSVTEYLEEARSCPKWLGREIRELQHLPEEVVTYIKQITSEL